MNTTCYFPGCNKKATIYCECIGSSLFICLSHLSSHTSNAGNHNPKKIPDISQKSIQRSTMLKCEGKSCNGLAKVYCGCSGKSLCLCCLDAHLLENNKIIHNIEVINQNKPNYEDTIHPLDVFLRRAQCDSSIINKVKMKSISIREILNWDMRTLNSMTEYLGLNSTMKYLLWEEINYIKIVTEKYYLKNDYMSRLVFGIEGDDDVEIVKIDKKDEEKC